MDNETDHLRHIKLHRNELHDYRIHNLENFSNVPVVHWQQAGGYMIIAIPAVNTREIHETIMYLADAGITFEFMG